MGATRWSDTIALVDEATGDFRRFAKGSLDHRELPLPVQWVRQASFGHDGSVVVGVMDELDTEGKGGKVLAGGRFFDDVDAAEMPELAQNVAEAVKLATEGAIGPSVDLEPDMDVAMVRKGEDTPLTEDELWDLTPEDEIELLITRARIIGVTLVSGPAFEHSSSDFQVVPSEDVDEDGCPEGSKWNPDIDECEKIDASEEAALVASVIGSTSLPVGERDHAWSGSGATGRMFEAATGEDGTVDVKAVSKGFLYKDPDADAQTKAAYKLPFADVVDGTLTIIPKGVAATAGGRGVGAADIPDSEKSTIRTKICTLYGKVRSKFDDWPECPFDSSDDAALVASMSQAIEVHRPAAALFADPKLTEPTVLTWDETGHVFGHIALNASCHRGFPDMCVTPPSSAVEYSHFHRYAIEVVGDGGEPGLVWAGRLTAGGGHATLDKSMTATVGHYDKLTTAAYVVAGEDQFGIWVSGALQPGLDERTMGTLSRRKPSGDWRATADGLELIEVLALPEGPRELSEPGYPVQAHVSNGRRTALVAAIGPVSRETDQPVPFRATEIDYDKLGMAVADAMALRERTQVRKAELAAAIDAETTEARDRARAELAAAIGV